MRTEELIARLAREAVPVTPLHSVPRRLVAWLALAVAAAALGVVSVGLRPDLDGRMRDLSYVVSLALTVAAGIAAAAAALALAVPDERRSRLVVLLPLALFAGWGALLTARLISGGAVTDQFAGVPAHPACLAQITLAALVPAMVLFRQLRRAAPLDLFRSAALAALGALGLAAAGAQIACPIDAPAHLLPWHFAPVVGLAIASLFWARPVLGRVATHN